MSGHGARNFLSLSLSLSLALLASCESVNRMKSVHLVICSWCQQQQQTHGRKEKHGIFTLNSPRITCYYICHSGCLTNSLLWLNGAGVPVGQRFTRPREIGLFPFSIDRYRDWIRIPESFGLYRRNVTCLWSVISDDNLAGTHRDTCLH